MEFRINSRFEKSIEVEKSEFIGILFPCDSKEEFITEFEKIKKEHNKARHHCYSYIIDGEIKYSDDGEPQGTAGKPLLGILQNRNLNHCALVVVRYFGGTLLGSGRLLRTYVAAGTNVVDSAKLTTIEEEFEIKVDIEIDSFDIFKNYLSKRHFVIKETKFNDKIEMVFYAPLNFNENLDSLFFPKVKVLEKKVVKHAKEVI